MEVEGVFAEAFAADAARRSPSSPVSDASTQTDEDETGGLCSNCGTPRSPHVARTSAAPRVLLDAPPREAPPAWPCSSALLGGIVDPDLLRGRSARGCSTFAEATRRRMRSGSTTRTPSSANGSSSSRSADAGGGAPTFPRTLSSQSAAARRLSTPPVSRSPPARSSFTRTRTPSFPPPIQRRLSVPTITTFMAELPRPPHGAASFNARPLGMSRSEAVIAAIRARVAAAPIRASSATAPTAAAAGAADAASTSRSEVRHWGQRLTLPNPSMAPFSRLFSEEGSAWNPRPPPGRRSSVVAGGEVFSRARSGAESSRQVPAGKDKDRTQGPRNTVASLFLDRKK